MKKSTVKCIVNSMAILLLVAILSSSGNLMLDFFNLDIIELTEESGDMEKEAEKELSEEDELSHTPMILNHLIARQMSLSDKAISLENNPYTEIVTPPPKYS